MAARLINLTNVNKIVVSFCGFDVRSKSAREFLRCLYAKKVLESNPKCTIRSKVKNDNSEPSLQVTLSNGQENTISTAALQYFQVVDKFHSITGFTR